jgi:hypothetical protein
VTGCTLQILKYTGQSANKQNDAVTFTVMIDDMNPVWCKWLVESELVHTFLACTNVYLVLKYFVLHEEKYVECKLYILIL